jgi:hypothetical protein
MLAKPSLRGALMCAAIGAWDGIDGPGRGTLDLVAPPYVQVWVLSPWLLQRYK